MLSKFDLLFQQVLRTLTLQSLDSDLELLQISQPLKDWLKGLDQRAKKASLFWIKRGLFQREDGSFDEDLLKNGLSLLGTKIKNFESIRTREALQDLVQSGQGELNKSKARVMARAFNPDSVPEFNRHQVYQAGGGVKIYRLDDDRSSFKAARRAIDYNWGFDANPWCLLARWDQNTPKDQQITNQQALSMSEEEREKLYSDEWMNSGRAWGSWKSTYTAYPKRIAFKNGKLLAFCASSSPKIKWWNRMDHEHSFIPDVLNIQRPDPSAQDDQEFIEEFISKKAWLIAKVQNPNTSQNELEKLAHDENRWVREVAIQNPSTPPEVLARLAEDEDAGVRTAVAKNPSTSPEALARLAEDEDYLVRKAVARNSSTPPETLARFAESEDYWVRKAVAQNPSTLPETLARLAEDEDYLVRETVASNPSTSPETLAGLAEDEDRLVRYAVSRNPSTPSEALAKLV